MFRRSISIWQKIKNKIRRRQRRKRFLFWFRKIFGFFVPQPSPIEILTRRLRYLAIFLLVTVILLTIVGVATFRAFSPLYKGINDGYQKLAKAFVAAQENKFELSKLKAKEAYNIFNRLFVKYNRNFKYASPTLNKEKENSNLLKLAESGQLLAKALYQSNDLRQLSVVSHEAPWFMNFGAKDNNLGTIGNIEKILPELQGIKANFELADSLLRQNKQNFLAFPIKIYWRLFDSGIRQQKEELEAIIQKLELMLDLGGYSSAVHYLLVFQDDAFLTPDGGIVWGYADAVVERGQLKRWEIVPAYKITTPASIYPADWPKELNFVPFPSWYPDWSAKARLLQNYFKEQYLANQLAYVSQNYFSGVVALNTSVLGDLLPATSSEDWISWQHCVALQQNNCPQKDDLVNFLSDLPQKIVQFKPSRAEDWQTSIKQRLERGDIRIYLNNVTLQYLVKERGWTGGIKKWTNDYLWIGDTNLSPDKTTDWQINKQLHYKIEDSGKIIIAEAELLYANLGAQEYQSMVEAIVPMGIDIMEADGVDIKKLILYNWRQYSVLRVPITVPAGEIKKVMLRYQLPEFLREKLSKLGYRLAVIKQPGRKINNLKVDLSFANKIQLYNPTGFSVARNEDKRIVWITDLKNDKIFDVWFRETN